MPVDDDADRRADKNRDWAKIRHRAKTEPTRSPYASSAHQSQTRKQVATRVQRAAGDALAALRRHQREERGS